MKKNKVTAEQIEELLDTLDKEVTKIGYFLTNKGRATAIINLIEEENN